MSSTDEGAAAGSLPGQDASGLALRSWRDARVLSLALLAMAAGFGQFGVVAALGDVAKSFGAVHVGTGLSQQAGLSGTTIGLGLAIIRLASLGSLFVASWADRIGRRRTLLTCLAIGLMITAASAASPSYWWFVAIFALGRPLLSAGNALAGVCAAEETGFADRAKAMALVAAGYAGGAGLLAFIHGLDSSLGFRGTVLLSLLPLACLPALARIVEEPDRYARYAVASEHKIAIIGSIPKEHRSRLILICLVVMGVSIISGPANSFIFLYTQNVVHMSGGTTSVMIACAGVTGVGGLVLGRYLADHIGRRPAVVLAVVGVAALGFITYSGSQVVVFVGYVLGVLAGAVLAPSLGSYVNELFPTSIRASVAGIDIAAGVVGAIIGLLVFGAVADATNHFGWGAAATFGPALVFLIPLLFLPETKGHEPEELWVQG